MSRFSSLYCFTAVTYFLCASAYVLSDSLYVSKTTDTRDGSCDTDCSIREAIDHANQRPGPDRIYIPDGHYTISIAVSEVDDYGAPIDEDQNVNGDFDITDDLDIVGNGEGVTIIDAQRIDRGFEIIAGDVTLSRLAVVRGYHPDSGAGALNHDRLTLWYTRFENNRASAAFRAGQGGGIVNRGILRVFASDFINNASYAGEASQGLGGAIINRTGASLIVRETQFSGNLASDDNDSSVGGAIFNAGRADIRRSSFVDNSVDAIGQGAALLNAGGFAKLTSVTVSQNRSGEFYGGGAVANGAYFRHSSGQLFLTQVTIVNNIHRGLYTRGATYIRNSIMSGNYPDHGEYYEDIKKEYMSAQDWDVRRLITGLDLKTFAELLEPLAKNGGRTLSHNPLPTSDAIDAGGRRCPAFDQRAQPAPFKPNAFTVALCDIGAIEYRAPTIEVQP